MLYRSPARFTLTLVTVGLLTACVLGFAPIAFGQSVPVGQGSYATTLPPGTVGPLNEDGQPAVPLVAEGFGQPVQTNDFWSSLLYPFFGDPHSSLIFAHPLQMKATADGLQVGHTANPIFPADDYLFVYEPQMSVGLEGLNVAQTTASGYGDWTVTARWDDGPSTLEATLGHGLPFVFFERTGTADARIVLFGGANVFRDDGNALGLTINGRHFGIFGPDGSDWTVGGTLTSTLAGEDYFSVALLPDPSPGTFERFRDRAYAFVTGSRVDWTYDEDDARLRTTYTYTTDLKESGDGQFDETLTALYRHQWLHTDTPTAGTYASPRGEMRLLEGTTFATSLPFDGVLPSLPDVGAYDRETLGQLVQDVATETLPAISTYDSGKSMGRFARLVHIADQLGLAAERDYFLAQIKLRLEDWFTAGGAQQYVYDDTWDVLTGYPSSFGADSQINDHHFHHGYAIMAAATVAQYDPEWAAQENWGGMVNLLIRDANSWDRTDPLFPFLRAFDAYAGHGWASGHGAFGDGNNQESSSESMQFAAATVLWGEMTDQPEIRDLGVYLYATEASAVEQYWFDVDDVVFPAAYPRIALGIVWGSKGAHATFFGGEPEFIHGINILPITGGSLYLGRHPDYVSLNYDTVVNERGGEPAIWPDVFWEYLAFSEPERALTLYLADPNYEPFDGESRAHTQHWLYNLETLGRVDTTITANVPTFGVFRPGEAGFNYYVAFNAEDDPRTVLFSDGFALDAAPRSLAVGTTPIVSTDDGAATPDRFEVFPNAPNPFAARTTIRYRLPAASEVTVEVFDTLGRTVYERTLPMQRAGMRTVEIDAGGWQSGVYLGRLRTDRAAQTIPMTVLR